MAKEFKQLPSTILKVNDDYDAFRVDRMVWLFGSSLQAAINAVDETDPKKRQREQQRVLGKWIPEAEVPLEQRFRDPGK